MAGVVYFDASALVKLVRREEYSDQAESAFKSATIATSSVVVEVELLLAVGRSGRPDDLKQAHEVLASLTTVELDRPILDRASGMLGLRTLDAIHLASALGLKSGLDSVVVYDRRLASEAQAAGLHVLAPGAPGG